MADNSPLRWQAFADDLPPAMDHGVGGRKPSQFSIETARIILAQVERGDTIAAIVARPGMPSRRTLYDWLRDNPDFGGAWDELRGDQAKRRLAAMEHRRATKRACGRKSTYSHAVARAWCDLISEGLTQREASARPGMPAVAMVHRWLRDHPEFREMYVFAAAYRDFVLTDGAIDLANTLGYAARPQVDALRARAAALRPDVWRWWD